jgi:hypothetical protein
MSAGEPWQRRRNVVAPAWSILKHEDLAPALGPQVEQLVTGAAQETNEIAVAGFEGGVPPFVWPDRLFS